MSICIKYIIPEDGDEIDHPNVFNLQSSSSSNNNPTLRDVKKSFPPPGEYHFRFLKQLSPENKVWLDLVNDSDSLPSINGSIFAKVSRISISNSHNNNFKSAATASSGLASSVRATAGRTSSPTGNNNKGGIFNNNKEVNLLGDDHDDFHSFTSAGTANGSITNGAKSSAASASVSTPGGHNVNPVKPSRPSGGGGGSIASASPSGKPPVNLFDTTEFEAAGDLLDMTSSSNHKQNAGSYNVDLFDTANFTTAKPTSNSSPTAVSNTSSTSFHSGLKNSVSVDRGIDSINNAFPSTSQALNNQAQQQPMRSVQQQQQGQAQQQLKQSQTQQLQQQPLRGESQTRDAFSGLGDFNK